MHFQEEIKILLNSRCPYIYILTEEEERVEYVINTVITNNTYSSIYFWDFVSGYQGAPNELNNAKRNPLQALEFIESFDSNSNAVFILRDFNFFLSDLSISRKMRNLSRKLKTCNQNVILIASEVSIPVSLRSLTHIITFPLPNITEIKLEVLRIFKVLDQEVSIDELNSLVLRCRGLSIEAIRHAVSKILISSADIASQGLELIMKEKREIIRQTNILDLDINKYILDEIGGIDSLKEWLNQRTKAFSQTSIDYGIPLPKGILLVGIQGTGKSISAKGIASTLGLALLRLDVGKLFAGIVGESELQVRRMIQMVEAASPCVLWIDEIDKIFGQAGHSGDGGTSNRVLGTLLTWLSEKSSSVFIVATANNLQSLPAELIRKGRFDEIFFIDLPNLEEREMIFQMHLSKVRPYTWNRYNIRVLAKYTHLFSGAEIKQVINNSMHSAFSEEREFNSQDVLVAIQQLIPLAFTDKANIAMLQQWARLGKIRYASKYR
jgi:AAA+ superfamily predicted ATPase